MHMETFKYKLDQFEGPLDLLLTLIAKNKVNIEDIPISLICGQYLDYIRDAEAMDMDVASEFIVMASELMLIKSRILLPKPEAPNDDPRKQLTDALIRYRLAKAAAIKLAERYALYSGRQVKDTDEISVDRTYVADQDPETLKMSLKRVRSYMDALENAKSHVFTPMISRRIVSVEVKIGGIIRHLNKTNGSNLSDLLQYEETLSDIIATFIAVLELIRVHQIIIDTDGDDPEAVHGLDTRLILNTDETTIIHDNNLSANETLGSDAYSILS